MKKILCVVALAMLPGCAGPVTNITTVGDYSKSLSASTKGLCILVPPDPVFENEIYSGVGQDISKLVLKSIRYAGTTSAELIANGDRALACNKPECEYVLPVDILHFEDHPTGWNGKPDKISLSISIHSCVASIDRGFTFNSSTNMLNSGFTEWGNRSPLDLINHEFDEQLKKLLR